VYGKCASAEVLRHLNHNLPLQVDRIIGLEREMVEIKDLLATTSLLTITGACGSGKTRLAFQVATDLISWTSSSMVSAGWSWRPSPIRSWYTRQWPLRLAFLNGRFTR
jgi:hypothetical protein